jgi:hypothetical protein
MVAFVALLLLSLAAPAGAEAALARLTFIKEFRGSRPEYVRVTVDEAGEASFEGGDALANRESEPFRLSPTTTRQLFALAARLDYLQGVTLESPKPVANLGRKTLVYEKGRQRAEVTFNWTENQTGAALQALFERIARGRWLAQQLAYQLTFDRLGIVTTLREFEQEFNHGGLVDPEQFAPVLERIAGDRRVARLAQARAQSLLRRIRGAPGRLDIEFGDQRAGRYERLSVEETGAATLERRRFADAPNPQPLALPPAATNRLLQLVRESNFLRDHAGYGEPSGVLAGYRIVYESGALHNEVYFLTPPSALLAEMTHLFHQVLAQMDFRQRLGEARADETALLVFLQELDAAVLKDTLLDPPEFLPALDGIALGGFGAPVRGLAARIAERIRAHSAKPAPANESPAPRTPPRETDRR